MCRFQRFTRKLGWSLLSALSALALSGAASAIPVGWTCEGTCGELGADGVVVASPQGGDYSYVSSDNGVSGVGLTGSDFSGTTNGSRLRSNVFGATSGEALQFYFNFVTSDGAGYADYAWARLLDSGLSEVALLFTARTTPGGNTVPGFGMPAISATIDPALVTVVAGAPWWSALGGSSGTCYATGCGYTGWVQSYFAIQFTGNYVLEFGVANWSDTAYDTGMAIDGILVGGKPINEDPPPGSVPVPATLALLSLGLFALGALRRRKIR